MAAKKSKGIKESASAGAMKRLVVRKSNPPSSDLLAIPAGRELSFSMSDATELGGLLGESRRERIRELRDRLNEAASHVRAWEWVDRNAQPLDDYRAAIGRLLRAVEALYAEIPVIHKQTSGALAQAYLALEHPDTPLEDLLKDVPFPQVPEVFRSGARLDADIKGIFRLRLALRYLKSNFPEGRGRKKIPWMLQAHAENFAAIYVQFTGRDYKSERSEKRDRTTGEFVSRCLKIVMPHAKHSSVAIAIKRAGAAMRRQKKGEVFHWILAKSSF